ncbi:MAG: PEP-CTERM sorting domain-containing protein [Pirellulales bacterium]|nr:PEP-CTERM sorting domain-containing protein [Pirellulales bacterium]
MKWNGFAWALAALACMTCAAVVQAEMLDNTNVAYMKNVYGYPENTEYYQPTSHYGSWEPVIVDDVFYQNPANYAYVNRTVDSYFRVDLGSVMDVDWVELWHNNWKYLKGNKVQGLDSGLNVVDEFVVPTTVSGNYYRVDVDWQDIQYVRLLDVTSSENLQLSELRVGSDVVTHPTYIGNVSVNTTNELNAGTGWWEAINLTNNKGMTDQGVGVGNPAAKSIATAGNWLSTDLSGGGADPVLTFDLNGDYEMDMIRIWNHNFANTATSLNHRGTQHCLIEYSDDDGVTYTPLADTNGGDLGDGNYTIPEAPGDLSTSAYPMYDAQLQIDLGGLTADHFRITSLSNYNDGDETGQYRGLSEVRFYQVPEPSTFVGLITLGLVCLVLRRRR